MKKLLVILIGLFLFSCGEDKGVSEAKSLPTVQTEETEQETEQETETAVATFGTAVFGQSTFE